MCGISGVLSAQSSSSLKMIATRMSSIQNHRGPDSSGIWANQSNTCALSHARLAIIDLSSAGHQPMQSKCGRYTMAFNGEIYNHKALKEDLDKLNGVTISWEGHSDTEILLAAISIWGLEITLQKTVGMFAIALWDLQNQSLSLARDRIGEKPLYYGWVSGQFGFASELKAFKAFPNFANSVDKSALNLFLQCSYVPTPYSIYKDIFKLEPGAILTIKQSDASDPPNDLSLAPYSSNSLKIKKYWSFADIAFNGQQNLLLDENEALTKLEKILTEAITTQSISDVPIGSFLSGGVDSSLVTALMQKNHPVPVNTFSMGFHDANFNEAEDAKKIAKFLGTNHQEIYVSDQEARDVIPTLASIYSEPFGDSSQIPTYLLSKLARSHVTVALTGDAGDEIFGGYNRYSLGSSMFKKLSFLPGPLKQMLGSSLESISPETLDRLAKFIPGLSHLNLIGDKTHKFARGLRNSHSFDAFYKNLILDPSFYRVAIDNTDHLTTLLDQQSHIYDISEPEHRMMAWDSLTYLPDDILCKVDRASMSVSLETRVPMLDHRLIEFAWTLPLNMKIRDGQSKWILKKLLYQHVPQSLVDRPKKGFSIPLGDWLRGPLRDWVEHLLDEEKIKSQGYLDYELIHIGWTEHLNKEKDWSRMLWNILMFQSWLEFDSNPVNF